MINPKCAGECIVNCSTYRCAYCGARYIAPAQYRGFLYRRVVAGWMWLHQYISAEHVSEALTGVPFQTSNSSFDGETLS